MKKNILVILINLFLLLIFLAALEIYCYKSIFVTSKWELPNYKKFFQLKREFVVDNHLYTNYEKPTKLNQLAFENDGRSFVGANYNTKKPILLLGCSYTYGLGLKKDDTFGYQLSKYTKRPVYNWAWKTEGPDYSLLELNNEENISMLKQNPPEYIVYTYMYDHPRRLIESHRQYRWYYLRKYNLINNQKPSTLDNSYLYLALRNKMFEKYMKSENQEDKLFNYIASILIEMKNTAVKQFPDAKFVVLIYMDSPENIKTTGKVISPLEEKILYSKKWKHLEKQGFIVITTQDLLGRTMDRKEDLLKNDYTATSHPTPEIWAKIVPLLSSELKL